MNQIQKNILYILIISIITIAFIIIVPQIPNFSKPSQENNLPFTLKWTIVFLIVNLILIGIPAWIHKKYTNDYSKIKSIWFFALFGGITGAMLGEQGNFIMIIPYAILMLIYALFYKKFIWWKIVLTTYFAGMVIENVINRSPLQAPTLIWIAFFTYPYFATKLWENRKKIKFTQIIKDLKYTIISSVILTLIAIYISRKNPSPPLIFFAITIPFLIKIFSSLLRKK